MFIIVPQVFVSNIGRVHGRFDVSMSLTRVHLARTFLTCVIVSCICQVTFGGPPSSWSIGSIALITTLCPFCSTPLLKRLIFHAIILALFVYTKHGSKAWTPGSTVCEFILHCLCNLIQATLKAQKPHQKHTSSLQTQEAANMILSLGKVWPLMETPSWWVLLGNILTKALPLMQPSGLQASIPTIVGKLTQMGLHSCLFVMARTGHFKQL